MNNYGPRSVRVSNGNLRDPTRGRRGVSRPWSRRQALEGGQPYGMQTATVAPNSTSKPGRGCWAATRFLPCPPGTSTALATRPTSVRTLTADAGGRPLTSGTTTTDSDVGSVVGSSSAWPPTWYPAPNPPATRATTATRAAHDARHQSAPRTKKPSRRTSRMPLASRSAGVPRRPHWKVAAHGRVTPVVPLGGPPHEESLVEDGGN